MSKWQSNIFENGAANRIKKRLRTIGDLLISFSILVQLTHSISMQNLNSARQLGDINLIRCYGETQMAVLKALAEENINRNRNYNFNNIYSDHIIRYIYKEIYYFNLYKEYSYILSFDRECADFDKMVLSYENEQKNSFLSKYGNDIALFSFMYGFVLRFFTGLIIIVISALERFFGIYRYIFRRRS